MKNAQKIKSGLTGLFILFLLVGCLPDPVRVLDDELVAYFDRFEQEATRRNVSVQLGGIDGVFADTLASTKAGTCQTLSTGRYRILVNASYWNQATALEREFVVFHELGHCALKRDHTDAATPSGVCQSIMTSGTGRCKMNYTASNRSTYLDELFSN